MRAIFHPTVGNLLALDLSAKVATPKLGYEAMKKKDTGLCMLFLSYLNPPVLMLNQSTPSTSFIGISLNFGQPCVNP